MEKSVVTHSLFYHKCQGQIHFFFTICMRVVRGSGLGARVSINLQHINVTLCTVQFTRDIFFIVAERMRISLWSKNPTKQRQRM